MEATEPLKQLNELIQLGQKIIADPSNLKPGLFDATMVSGDNYDAWIDRVATFIDRYLKKHELYNKIRKLIPDVDWAALNACKNIINSLRTVSEDREFWENSENAVNNVDNSMAEVNNINMPLRIFISHNSKDKDYAEAFVYLFRAMGIEHDDIICTSVLGYGIKMGNDIYDYLAKQFKDYSLHVIFLLSKRYYKSAASLNEMGATWVLRTEYDSIILPGFTFREIEGAVNPRQIGMDLSKENELRLKATELRDRILNKYGKKGFNEYEWVAGLDKFVEKIAELRNRDQNDSNNDEDGGEDSSDDSTPRPVRPVSIINGIQITYEAKMLLSYASEDGYPEIKRTIDMTATHVESGKFEFTDGSARSAAEWDSQLETLEQAKLIHLVNSKPNNFYIYHLTQNGYKVADDFIKKNKIDINQKPDVYLNDSSVNDLTDYEKMVYEVIKNSEDGVSVQEIVSETKISQAVVNKTLKDLMKQKMIGEVGSSKNRRFLKMVTLHG